MVAEPVKRKRVGQGNEGGSDMVGDGKKPKKLNPSRKNITKSNGGGGNKSVPPLSEARIPSEHERVAADVVDSADNDDRKAVALDSNILRGVTMRKPGKWVSWTVGDTLKFVVAVSAAWSACYD